MMAADIMAYSFLGSLLGTILAVIFLLIPLNIVINKKLERLNPFGGVDFDQAEN